MNPKAENIVIRATMKLKTYPVKMYNAAGKSWACYMLREVN